MEDQKSTTLPVVFCEMCPEEDRKPAKKTCLKCEISMCVQHLQAHLTTPILLQTHPLTDPMTSGGATKCPQHGKLMEYYCLDDLTCVCVSCAIEDQHRLHNMKTFSTAHKELLKKLCSDQELLLKTDGDAVSLEKWMKNEKEKVTEASVRLIEAVSCLRDLTLTCIQTSVSARLVSIQASKNSIQAAQKEEDTYKFLQLYSQVHQDISEAKAVDLRIGLEPGPEQDKLVKDLNSETIIEQAVDLWGSLLMMIDPEHHQEIIPTSEDLFFEPEIFSPGMSLSADRREVFFSNKMGQRYATLLIQSTTSDDIKRWIISPPKNYDWIVGLCDKQSINNLKSGPVYGLSSEGKELSVLTTEYVEEESTNAANADGNNPRHQPKKQKSHQTYSQVLSNPEKDIGVETIEVVVDSAVLSFYSRSGQYNKQLIHSLNVDPQDKPMKPFVMLGKHDVNFNPQLQWTCSCGRNHYIGHIDFHALPKCKCRAVIGGISTTELICKLV